LPKVMIEAMASGLVCIGTPISGIVDLIRDGENGYLTEGIEAEAIAETVRRAFEERDAGLGRRARAIVEEAFSLERYAAREAALYLGLDQK
ncbi:MAG TPA: glycosyltransferase, partial [Allosphingosinicella sp.]|nr:glycosyltransferase [Allosphingosinicella sp.]